MKRYLILLILSCCLSSCEQVIDSYWENKQKENYKSPYAGTYNGTYSGQDSGTLKVKISTKDVVTVTRNSNTFKTSETFTGTLIGSSFYSVKSSATGFTLMGSLSSQTSVYSGNWTQDSMSGTWNLTK